MNETTSTAAATEPVWNKTTRRRAERRNRRLAARLLAMIALHAKSENGNCAHCRVAWPCPTRVVERLALDAVDAPAFEKHEARAIADAAVFALHTEPLAEPMLEILTDEGISNV